MHKIKSLILAAFVIVPGVAFAQIDTAPAPAIEEPAPIPPPVDDAAAFDPLANDASTLSPASDLATPAGGEIATASASDRSMNDFQGDDVATVLRLLARQAKANLVISDAVAASQMTVTMRLENKSPMETINIISRSKGLVVDEVDGVLYVKTQGEKTAEPTEPAFYIFSYAKAEIVAPLLQSQLGGAAAPQTDLRTNTVFYQVAESQKDAIALFLETIDKPTKQVMIEARLVEVTANPKQSYGIDWSGVAAGRTLTVGGSTPASFTVTDGVPTLDALPGANVTEGTGAFVPQDFLFDADKIARATLSSIGSQFAILSTNQLSLTLNLLNQDADAEFLANPRVVTADNQEATIKIIRNQPVPQLNFNEQTATAVFGGFEDKEFGNTLIVKPSVNKDSFITLSVKPEISNKVGDATFAFAGAVVSSPVIDTRSLESNVLIKSGDTLAIGGLLQDELRKGGSKVPILGDIPVFGYLFQNRTNERTKRNLLVFVTPTIIEQGYGTGLEDQVTGIHHTGEEFADPNGWRNNARGSVRLVPTAHRQVASDYPAPGTPIAPERSGIDYRASAAGRER